LLLLLLFWMGFCWWWSLCWDLEHLESVICVF